MEPIEALLETVKYLVTVESQETKYGTFDIGSWWVGSENCGSAGCLGGHMAVMFPECGLSLVRIGDVGEERLPSFMIFSMNRQPGYNALAELFDGVLTEDEIDYLFSPLAYVDEDDIPYDPTPKDVGQRVLDLLLQKGLIDENLELVIGVRNDG